MTLFSLRLLLCCLSLACFLFVACFFFIYSFIQRICIQLNTGYQCLLSLSSLSTCFHMCLCIIDDKNQLILYTYIRSAPNKRVVRLFLSVPYTHSRCFTSDISWIFYIHTQKVDVSAQKIIINRIIVLTIVGKTRNFITFGWF